MDREQFTGGIQKRRIRDTPVDLPIIGFCSMVGSIETWRFGLRVEFFQVSIYVGVDDLENIRTAPNMMMKKSRLTPGVVDDLAQLRGSVAAGRIHIRIRCWER